MWPGVWHLIRQVERRPADRLVLVYCFGPRVTAQQVLDNLDVIAKSIRRSNTFR
jgi:hypothetical protein